MEVDSVYVPAHDIAAAIEDAVAAAIEDAVAAINPLNSMDRETASRKGMHSSIQYLDSGRSSNDESAN